MSSELDRKLARLYESLGTETQYAPMPAAEELRRRGDRRTLSRTTLAVAAAALLATGVAVGGNQLLGRDGSRVVPAPPVPSATPSGSPSVSPSVSPSPSDSPAPSASRATSPATPTRGTQPPPTSVPNSVFLTSAEINGEMADSDQGVQFPDLCGRGPVEDPRAALARVRSGFAREPGVPVDNVPDATLYHSVARYPSTARALAWMLDLEDAVLTCPVMDRGNGGGRTLYRLLPGQPALGDQVLFIEEKHRVYDVVRERFTDNYSVVYTVAIRHGDSIAVIYTQVYEDFGFTGPTRMRQLAAIAADRLEEWRGVVTGSS
jgi:hypothetical protein